MCTENNVIQNHTFSNINKDLIAISNEIFPLQSYILNTFDKITLQEFGVLKDIESAIDIGCANGYHLKYYSEIYPKTQWTGIDANPEFIKKAKEVLSNKPNVQLEHVSLLNYTTNKKFDAVFTCAVLQYIPAQIDNYFRLVKKILKPGGFIFILESESSYKIYHPQLKAVEKFLRAFDGKFILDGTISRRLPEYMEQYGFAEIEYKPLVINQYNINAELYFKLISLTARIVRILAPESYSEQDLNEMLALTENKEKRKGFICNLAGAYVKGIMKS